VALHSLSTSAGPPHPDPVFGLEHQGQEGETAASAAAGSCRPQPGARAQGRPSLAPPAPPGRALGAEAPATWGCLHADWAQRWASWGSGCLCVGCTELSVCETN